MQRSENEVLSTIDKQFIVSAKMYSKSNPGVGGPVKELTVNARRRTAATMGKLGEEDLFKFTAAQAGRYVIDTRGPTDVVSKLFGPNSQTALVAEDNDSGVDTNARLVAHLIEGEYFVQIRHWNRASGMGNTLLR